MAKLYTLIVFILMLHLASNVIKAQDTRVYNFDNGEKVAVDILSVDPDKGRNNSVYVGYYNLDGINNLGVTIYKPTKYYISGLAGIACFTLDGNIFFLNKLKDCDITQSVKSESYSHTITRYKITVPAFKRVSYGVHMGASYADFHKLNYELNTDYESYSAWNVFGGLSLLKAKHTSWKVYDTYKRVQGTLTSRLNMDVIYYTNIKQTYPNTPPPNKEKIGYRIYLDKKTTIWSRGGRISFNYLLGVGRNTNTRKWVSFIGGIGLGFNW